MHIPADMQTWLLRRPTLLVVLFLTVGGLVFSVGLEEAKVLRRFAGAKPVVAKVTSVTKQGMLWPDWTAHLKWGDRPVRTGTLPIAARHFWRTPELSPGDTLEIVAAPDDPTAIVRADRVQDKTRLTVLGVEFTSDPFWLSMIMFAAAALCLVFGGRIQQEADSGPGRWEEEWLLVFPFVLAAAGGGWLVWEGFSRGAQLAHVDPQRVLLLIVDGKVARPGSITDSYYAYGRVAGTGERAEVRISRPQFETWAVGRGLEVHALGPKGAGFVTKTSYDAAWPLLRLFGVTFSWHLILGASLLGLAVALPVVIARSAAADESD
jgi:hypothetical protein